MGLNLREYIGTDFLKVEDLKLSNAWVIKDIVEVEQTNDKNEIVKKAQVDLEHQGVEKSFTLNSTNTKRLVSLFGEDSDGSLGKALVFKVVEVSYKGKETHGLRIDEESTKAHWANQPVKK